ncbi:MAG: hypothetical protein CMJ36_04140 [Phycisphaerae bacterium]|nr:hypothetical protein [Phycisphaerae bacterium]
MGLVKWIRASVAFVVVVIATPSMGVDVTPTESQDGFAYGVSTFGLKWNHSHPDLPSMDSLLSMPIALTRTPEGWIGPRPGHVVVTSLGELNAAGGGTFWSSALGTISTNLSAKLIQDGLMGVFVTVDQSQISAAADSLGQDLRQGWNLELDYIMTVGRISEVRTVAAGDRLDSDAGINNPVHQRIIDESPLKGDSEDTQGDLLWRKQLEEYFLYLSRHPGRTVEASVAASSQPGGVSLDFLVRENKPLTLIVELSNTGTSQEGYFRQRYGLYHSQLTGNDDTLSLTYLTSDFDRSNAFFGKYDARLPGTERMRWSLAGDWSQFVADEFGILTDAFEGDSWSVTGDVTANIVQNGSFFLDLVAGLRYQHLFVRNNLFQVESSVECLLPIIMLEADHLGDWSNFNGTLGLEFNTLGNSEEDLVLMGRFDPSENWARMNWSAVNWVFLEPLLNPAGWADPSTPESSTLAHELMLSFSGQYAFNSRLIPQFQGVLGGMYSVRGYPQSVAAGDSTLLAKAEYRFHVPRIFAIDPVPMEFLGDPFRAAPQHVYGRPDWDLMLCAFIDAGTTMQSHRTFFESDETLIGTGVGFEILYKQNLRFRLDWGFPLKDLPAAGVEVGDERVYVSGSIIF